MWMSNLAAAALMLVSPICMAQSLETLEEAEQRVIEVWNTMPIVFRRALFATEEPTGFGGYSPRASSEFKPDEPLFIYSEPVGYAWRENDDESYTIEFGVDLRIKRDDGKAIVGVDDFGHIEVDTMSPAREFMLKVTVNLEGIPSGDYVMDIRARDLTGGEAGVFSLPFTIVD